MQLTSANLNTIRSHPHRTNLWLSIYHPNTLMTAIATGTYSTGDTQITYISASGSYLNLYPDITVMVGTQAGQDDIGRIRMRAATGTYVVFAENSLTVQSGHYLTMLDYVAPEAVYPRIIQDPSNEENVIFYKDGDIPYTNQNTIYGSFPCAGPHWATFLTTGTASHYFTATGTYNVAGQSLTYSWIFDGGTPTGSTAHTPGFVSYSQPGSYKTRLRVTAANGAVDDTYRYGSVYNRPGEGTSTPTLQWELQELSGSRSEGGYTASFKLYENIGEVEPNALVVIFADTWYGGTKTAIGGNAINNSSIVFVGYILSDTIKFDYKSSSVEFQVGSISEVMKNREGFSVSCESKASPSTWFELYEMTVPKAIYHYLRWHSTVLKTTDFQYTGDNRLVQYFDADRTSLFDAVDSFMREGMLGQVTSDRQGKLWAEINPFGFETPFSSIPVSFAPFIFHKQDWVGSPSIQERRNSELSFIELGGIAYYGVDSNLFSALLTNAPATAPLYNGKPDRNDGLILTSQQQLNNIAGTYLAYHNTKFPDVNLSIAGTYLNLDIAPLEQCRLVIDQNDSVRGKSIQDLRYVMEGIEWKYDSRDENFRPDVTLKQIATGTAGVTVLIPPVPPDGGYGYPEIDLPPLPEFGGTPGVGPTVNTSVIFHDLAMGFVYSQNFDSGSPNYITINAGLTQNQYQGANFMFVCPNGAFYVGCSHAYTPANTPNANDPFIARAPYVGGRFTVLEDRTTISAKYPTYPTVEHFIYGCTYNPLVPETVAYIMGENTTTLDTTDGNIWVGSNTSFTRGAHVTRLAPNIGQNGLSFGNNKWVYTGAKAALFNPAASWRFNVAGSSLEGADGADFGDLSEFTHIRPSPMLQDLYTVGLSTGDIRHSTDNGSTWRLIGNSLLHGGAGMAIEPSSGLYFMLRYDTGAKGRSTDGLATLTPLPTLPPGTYFFAYAGGTGTSSRWIAAKAVIRFSPDLGLTWLNKEGDYLTQIAAIPNINMIFVPGISQAHAQAT